MLDYLISNPDVANAVAAIASAILAAVACVIGLISLRVSRRTLEHQQEHNRLSVRPIPSIVVGDYENHLFVKIVNNGVGPLLISKICTPGSIDPEKALIFHMPELFSDVLWTNFVEDTKERSIPPGSELVILDFDSKSSSSQDRYAICRDKVRAALGDLSIELEYTDVYNTNLPRIRRDLKWFRRHQKC